ncbi:DUF4817 domain-containing protein [Trichonephila clavipes]|nr:DUF4817 domain-containing protein [Trichonephila clavipes]
MEIKTHDRWIPQGVSFQRPRHRLIAVTSLGRLPRNRSIPVWFTRYPRIALSDRWRSLGITSLMNIGGIRYVHIHSYNNKLSRVMKEVAEESMKRAAVEENSSSPDKLLTVSGDGTWKTRGHSSLIGVCTVIGAKNSCQVIYSRFGLTIHQNDHQARRRFVEWAQNEIAVVPDFHKRILFSDEAHFWLNGYVNKQNCRIWSEANPQEYVETPLHPEKLTLFVRFMGWWNHWSVLLQKR